MDTHIPQRRLATVVIIGLSVSLLVAGLARADNSAAQAGQTASQPAANVAVAQPRQQQAGMQALQAIGKARDLIAKQDLKAATAEVDQANTLLNTLANALPTAKARQKISAAKDTAGADTDWVSIDDSLDETALFMPVKTAKNQVNAAKNASEKGDTQTAKQSLEAALVSIQYSEIDLPLTSTQGFVQQAATALQKGNAKAADSALQSAEQGVIYLSTAVDQPLYQARYSLWEALVNLKNGAETDAKRHLDKALGYLQQAGKSTDKTISEAANALLAEGNALRNDMDKPTSATPTNHTDRLETLGLRTETWAERALNYAHAQWADLKSYSPLKIDLIESRFHLQNAVIDQTTGHDAKAAQAELEQTQR